MHPDPIKNQVIAQVFFLNHVTIIRTGRFLSPLQNGRFIRYYHSRHTHELLLALPCFAFIAVGMQVVGVDRRKDWPRTVWRTYTRF